MSAPSTALHAIIFQRMKAMDIELSETFIRVCPDLNTLADVHQFFRTVLLQLGYNPMQLNVMAFAADIDEWLLIFERDVLPFLKSTRFPHMNSPYDVYDVAALRITG